MEPPASSRWGNHIDSNLPEMFKNEVAGGIEVRFDSSDVISELDSKVSRFADWLLGSRGVVNLGRGVGGVDRFTSSEQKKSEEQLLGLVDEVASNTDFIGLGRGYIDHGLERGLAFSATSCGFDSYSSEQREAIEFLSGAGQLRVLEGKAGTGKTTVLKPVKEAYEDVGYRVVGTAFQGKVAQNLGRELGIDSYTLASLQLHWREYEKYKSIIESGGIGTRELDYARKQLVRHSPYQLDKKTVLLLDEGSMVSQGDWSNLLKEVSSKGAILRVVQDNAQIKSIASSDISRAVGEKANSIALTTNYRQKLDWQKQASSLINEHRFSEGLVKYEDNGDITYVNNLSTAMSGAVERYLSIVTNHSNGESLSNISIITKKNSTVNELNRQVFEKLSVSGYLGKKFKIDINEEGKKPVSREFAIGAEIVFKQNDFNEHVVKSTSAFNNKEFNQGYKSKGVANGTLGKISSYNKLTGLVRVILHDSGREVEFDSKKYTSIALGYAFTTNNEQGVTRDKVIAIPDRSLSAGDLTVMLTRHRDSIEIIANKEYYKDFRSIGSGFRADSGLIVDYSVSKEQKPYLDLINSYKEKSLIIYNHYKEINDHSGSDGISNLYEKIEKLVVQRESVARQIVDSWSKCKILAGQAKLGLEDLEVVAGVRERQLSRFERLSVDAVESYYMASLASREVYSRITDTHKGVLAEHHNEYSKYIELRNNRDRIAHEISQNPSLYKKFFKIRVNKDESGNIHGYSSFRHTYETRPAGFSRVLKQAKSYSDRTSSDYFRKSLSSEQKYIYEQLQIYSDASRTSSSSYYHLGGHLDDNRDNLLPKVRRRIEEM